MAANPEFENCKKLIRLYLKPEDINYGKEIKIAKKLLKLYPIEFFEAYSPDTTFTSLCAFLTKAGLRELENQFAMFKSAKPAAPVILSDEPQIQLLLPVENKKPKTILEFIDNE